MTIFHWRPESARFHWCRESAKRLRWAWKELEFDNGNMETRRNGNGHAGQEPIDWRYLP